MSVADIFLCFGDIQQDKDADEDAAQDAAHPKALSSNASFILDPSQLSKAQQQALVGDRIDPLPDPTFVLRFEQNIYNPDGWFFGSSDDTTESDFQIIADNSSGVSRKHILIDVDPDELRPRVTNRSSNAIRITGHTEEGVTRYITLEKGEHELLPGSSTLDFGPVTFSFRRPKLVAREDINKFRKHTDDFNKGVLAALPRNPKTGNLTPNMRCAQMGIFNTKTIYAAKITHYHAADNDSKPNVIEVVALIPGHGKEPAWLIMPYVEFDLSRVGLSDEDRPRALLDVASGLEYIHKAGLAHRDLSPRNILVQMESDKPDGRFLHAIIIDFGISKSKSTDMSTYLGTPLYMAPAFWVKDRRYTERVDVFSLGVIMIQLLTYWDGGTILQSDKKKLRTSDDFDYWFDILRDQVQQAPALLQEGLLGATEKQADQRWTFSQCREWLANYPPRPKKRPASQQLGPPGRQLEYMPQSRESSPFSIPDTDEPPSPCRASSPDSVVDGAQEQVAEDEEEEEAEESD
ncbi:kinase-like domain-containing protein [Microdochium trichocladiopsis]|uniref:Autophagy-related protein 1 n=1 Tax=Microdochium trichocladiopsis TaxID=1682393 RepID=A0A9P9BHE4_9PEZI|nr:kinase-like domain-containing protein [Microdochium trichocladiopsis]KAH7010699.1 kinase-like domain-containing protein [Microdochium trichocladiopsis]